MDERNNYGRSRNDIRDNDFSDAELIDVAFRTGVDLQLQKLPADSHYLYIANAPVAVSRAKERVPLISVQNMKRELSTRIKALEYELRGGQKQIILNKQTMITTKTLSRESVEELCVLLQSV